jgi:hypothetical protein
MLFSLSASGFDVGGIVGSRSIATSMNGYTARFAINSSSSLLSYGNLVMDSITVHLNGYILSPNALLLFVKMTNSGSSSRTVSLSISADIYFDGLDFAPMATLPLNGGFRIWSSENEIRFICRSYPLVRNVSAFWIGGLGDLSSNYWTQIGGGTVSGVDSAAAFSWQSISIRGWSSVTRGMIVRFGSDEASTPTLNLTFPNIPLPFSPSNPVSVTGTISFDAVNLRLLYVIDGDLSTLQSANVTLKGNWSVSFSFVPLRFGISDINHQIAFYAVTSSGDVSLPQTLMFSGIPIGEDSGVVAGPSISSSHSDNTGSIVGPIAAVTGVGLVGLIMTTLWIRGKRKASVPDERSELFLSV